MTNLLVTFKVSYPIFPSRLVSPDELTERSVSWENVYLPKVIRRRFDLYVLIPIYLALCISAICKSNSLVMFRCQTCITRGTRTLESLCNVHHLRGILTPLPTGRKLGVYTAKRPNNTTIVYVD